MDDYIRREDALEILKKERRRWDKLNKEEDPHYSLGVSGGFRIASNAIEDMPSADVRPVVRGRWIKNFNAVNPYDVYECSICKKAIFFPFSYCPKCGARMDGERK